MLSKQEGGWDPPLENWRILGVQHFKSGEGNYEGEEKIPDSDSS